MKAIYIFTILMAVAVIFVGLMFAGIYVLYISNSGLVRACSSDMYDRSFFKCEQNYFGAKYIAIPVEKGGAVLLDAPTTYYDAQGNEIAICGGIPTMNQAYLFSRNKDDRPKECTGLQKLKCWGYASCTINCNLLEGNDKDQCLFRQAEKTMDKSYCDQISETSDIKEACYNMINGVEGESQT